MNGRMLRRVLLLGGMPLLILLSACGEAEESMPEAAADWQVGPFEKYENNPILVPQGETWEAKDVFNPTTWSDGETVYMLYRAEDSTGIGQWNGTSRVGLATSSDGFLFEREPEPVLEPSEEWELPGGCEDPRVVKVDDTYYLTYTAYDGETARLALASSPDMRTWQKHGLVFPERGWTKSGADPGRRGRASARSAGRATRPTPAAPSHRHRPCRSGNRYRQP